MSSRLYHDIVSQRGSLENLVARMPSFKGYHEKQARRTADRLLREQITKELDMHIQRYNRLQNKLLDGGKGLKHMTRSREVLSKVQAYRDRVATAAPKYSGMFAQVKITEEMLDRIYAFDEAQFRFVLALENKIALLEQAIEANQGIEEALEGVYDAAAEANEAFMLRDDEILQISESV